MDLLQRYIEHTLKPFGYEDCNIHYSLNSCQGDGVAFYGSADLAIVGKRVGFDPDHILNKELLQSAKLTITGQQGRNHHSNSMKVELEWDTGDEYLNDAVAVVSDQLTDLIQEDVSSISRSLESFCYSIIHAGYYEPETILRKETKRFVVEILACPDRQMLSLDEQDENLIETLNTLIEQGHRYGIIKAKVYTKDNETGDVLSHLATSEDPYCAVFDPKKPHAVVRDALHDCLEIARKEMEKIYE